MKLCSQLISLLVSTSLVAPGAFAGTRIEQEVKSKLADQVFRSQFSWSIDSDKFKLEVRSEFGNATYLFNGRNFYICSKVEKKQLEFLTANKISDEGVLAKFRNGACQASPANFMARFFLSPIDAVEAIDRADGLKVSLKFNEYNVKKGPEGISVQNYKCENSKRTYDLNKTAVDDNSLAYATKSEDSLCYARSIEWRASLWREVSKSIMRQPGGMKLLKTLKQEKKEHPGLPLSGTFEVTRTLPDSTSIKGTRTLTTKEITEAKFDKFHFAIPSTYTVFAPDALASQIKIIKTGPLGENAKTGTASSSSGISDPSSVLICALSGSLLCLGTMFK